VIGGTLERTSDLRCYDFSLNRLSIPAPINLMRIEQSTFHEKELGYVRIRSSVEVIGRYCFHSCRQLLSRTFESVSRLVRIDDYAFTGTILSDIVIRSISEVIGGMTFIAAGNSYRVHLNHLRD
jgi:hypothetical protein